MLRQIQLRGPLLWAMLAAVFLAIAAASSHAQSPPPAYATMAAQPDPQDFVRRAGTNLTLLGNPLRFGGLNITWLGLRIDPGVPARRPTAFEVRDALATALAMGAAVIRVPGLASTAGCARCLEPTPGQMNQDVFAQIDLVLAVARDLGIKVILPLADAGADCAGAGGTGVICGSVHPPADARAFFTDDAIRKAFLARVQAILTHVNSRTGTAYLDDPTILAWEDCDACAAAPGADEHAVSAWVEQVGQAIKATDHRHLFEDGAFAGRIGRKAARPVAAALLAQPSVDIIGDHLAVHGDTEAMRVLLAETVAEMGGADRVYMLDSFGWSPSLWKTEADFEGWLSDMRRNRALAGALTGNLQAHAALGGYQPAPPVSETGMAALYFPGTATGEMDLPTMQTRGRALRRFNYAMADVDTPPSYLLPPQPEIIGTARGRLTWRGSAGAATYTIERSTDPSLPDTWTTVCDECVNDQAGFWQDPDHPAGPVWYRMMPLNINGHRAMPSEPVQVKD